MNLYGSSPEVSSSGRLLKKPEKQIPRGLNFTPTSAKTALVGDPCSPARDDKNKSLSGTAEAVPFQIASAHGVFQQPARILMDRMNWNDQRAGSVPPRRRNLPRELGW
jgi:hypothetical protein